VREKRRVKGRETTTLSEPCHDLLAMRGRARSTSAQEKQLGAIGRLPIKTYRSSADGVQPVKLEKCADDTSTG